MYSVGSLAREAAGACASRTSRDNSMVTMDLHSPRHRCEDPAVAEFTRAVPAGGPIGELGLEHEAGPFSDVKADAPAVEVHRVGPGIRFAGERLVVHPVATGRDADIE